MPSKLNAPWISSLNLRAKTSTTDEENLDAMVQDKGKAHEMPEDIHGGSYRRWRDIFIAKGQSNHDPLEVTHCTLFCMFLFFSNVR